jgi:hypothetical protein
MNQFAGNAMNAGKAAFATGASLGVAAAAGGIFAAILEVVGGLFEFLGPLIEGILSPLKAFGHLIGAFLSPVFTVLALAGSYLAESIYRAASFILSGIGKFLEFMGKLLNKLPGSLGNPLIAWGQSLRNQAAGLEASAKAQQDYRDELIHGADAVRKMADAVTDIPKAINLALYRSRIGSGVPLEGTPRGPGTVPPPPERPTYPRGGGGDVEFSGPVNIYAAPGDSGKDLLEKWERAVTERVAQGGYVLMPSGAW